MKRIERNAWKLYKVGRDAVALYRSKTGKPRIFNEWEKWEDIPPEAQAGWTAVAQAVEHALWLKLNS